MTPLISVVIPALNEERALPASLGALALQTLPADSFEVILVDNGSTDHTILVAMSFASRLRLRVLEQRCCSISALRNYGAAMAEGALLAFLDADCVPGRDWIESALSLLSDNARCVVGAGYEIPKGSGWVARAWYGGQSQKSGAASYLSGGDLLLSRDTFLAVGGFDEAIETSEDWEFCQRAQSRGVPVVACPRLAVVHLGTPQTLSAFYRKQYWHGTHAFKAVMQSATGWRSARAVWLAGWTLLTIFVLLFGLAAWTLGAPLWIGVAGWVAFLAAPMALAVRTARSRNDLLLIFPLTLLSLIYGMTRALCLAGVKLPRPDKPAVPDSLVG